MTASRKGWEKPCCGHAVRERRLGCAACVRLREPAVQSRPAIVLHPSAATEQTPCTAIARTPCAATLQTPCTAIVQTPCAATLQNPCTAIKPTPVRTPLEVALGGQTLPCSPVNLQELSSPPTACAPPGLVMDAALLAVKALQLVVALFSPPAYFSPHSCGRTPAYLRQSVFGMFRTALV